MLCVSVVASENNPALFNIIVGIQFELFQTVVDSAGADSER